MTLVKKLFLFFCFICVFLLSAGFASALEVQYPEILGHSVNSTSTLAEYICYLFGLLMDLAIFIALIAVAWGGVQYLFTLGVGKIIDPKKGTRAPDEAKGWIKAGILGLLIVACSSLIAYTINPNLTTCEFAFLPQVDISSIFGNSVPLGASVDVYKEIPIGTLTETLLTRTTNCYGFDQEGNPVDGKPLAGSNGKVAGPTYLNHDRADCLVQLVDGAQKKGQVVAELSNEITNLMNTCSCFDTNTGTSKCTPDYQCEPPIGACGFGSCVGPAIGGSCSQPDNTTDCCPDGVKNQIEHGQVNVSVDVGGEGCGTESKEYAGLDEFRCPNPKDKSTPCSGISSFVEKQVTLNNKMITIIDNDKWKKLNLTQQLTYFKEKIEELKQKIKKDTDELDKAKSTLASSKCYLTTPYVNLLKTYQTTKQQDKIILTQKAFNDPETNKPVDASKYCTGFNYDNSSCLKKCNDACPDTSNAAINLYKSNPTNIKDAYNKRPCIYGDSSQKFSACISSCQTDCQTSCSDKFLECSSEYDFCISQCKGNSQCVLDNANSCLINNKGFKDCTSETTDQGNTDYCINNTGAYLCKSGSSQYAGYSDCANAPNENCPNLPDQNSCKNETGCVWDGEKCSQNYSASFFYQNPSAEKCYVADDNKVEPLSKPDENSACYSKNAKENATCQDLCPEVSKCPASSFCPTCPCDQITDPNDTTQPATLEFSVPGDNIGDHIDSSRTILAYQMVGPQCNGYSYNDDPLTFYCQNQWWNDPAREGLNPEPIGAKRVCSAINEVPVGQTVDNAENWAKTLMDNADKMNKYIKGMLDKMKEIGDAYQTSPIQDYCKCNAKYDDAKPICKTDCQYWYLQIKGICVDHGCAPVPCQGKPCEQITDYLSELWDYYKTFKTDFIDFYITMLKEPRSDIMKELAYSRNQTNSCSVGGVAYGEKLKLLSCTRVEDEIIPPVNGGSIKYDNQTYDNYCYGKALGDILNKSLTDDWFCCENYSLSPSP